MSKGPSKKHYHAQRQGTAGTSAEYLGTAQKYREAWAIVTRAARTADGWYRVVECTAWHV